MAFILLNSVQECVQVMGGSYGALQVLQLPTEINHLIYWMLTEVLFYVWQDEQAEYYFGATSEEHPGWSGYYATSSLLFPNCSELFRPQVWVETSQFALFSHKIYREDGSSC